MSNLIKNLFPVKLLFFLFFVLYPGVVDESFAAYVGAGYQTAIYVTDGSVIVTLKKSGKVIRLSAKGPQNELRIHENGQTSVAWNPPPPPGGKTLTVVTVENLEGLTVSSEKGPKFLLGIEKSLLGLGNYNRVTIDERGRTSFSRDPGFVDRASREFARSSPVEEATDQSLGLNRGMIEEEFSDSQSSSLIQNETNQILSEQAEEQRKEAMAKIAVDAAQDKKNCREVTEVINFTQTRTRTVCD